MSRSWRLSPVPALRDFEALDLDAPDLDDDGCCHWASLTDRMSSAAAAWAARTSAGNVATARWKRIEDTRGAVRACPAPQLKTREPQNVPARPSARMPT